MENKKYLVPTGFGSPFSLCETHEFSVSREESGLAKAIQFAAKNNSNVYVQNINGKVELVWRNPALNIFN